MENVETNTVAVKWLRCLFYLHIASIVATLITRLPLGGFTFWLGRAVVLGVVICLYNLVPLNERYKKAFIFRGVMLILTVITALLYSSTFLTLAASVLSIIATYQEYHAHSELVEEKDRKLSRAWHSLFNWELLVSVLTGVLTSAAAVILVLGEIGTGATVAIITLLMQAVSLVLGILYLVYLHRTIRLFE